MDWISFNRELQNRVSDPGLRFMLGLIYERLLDQAKQMDMCAEVTNEMAQALNNFVALNEQFDGRLKALNTHVHGRAEGVSVESVPLINEDFKKN